MYLSFCFYRQQVHQRRLKGRTHSLAASAGKTGEKANRGRTARSFGCHGYHNYTMCVQCDAREGGYFVCTVENWSKQRTYSQCFLWIHDYVFSPQWEKKSLGELRAIDTDGPQTVWFSSLTSSSVCSLWWRRKRPLSETCMSILHSVPREMNKCRLGICLWFLLFLALMLLCNTNQLLPAQW